MEPLRRGRCDWHDRKVSHYHGCDDRRKYPPGVNFKRYENTKVACYGSKVPKHAESFSDIYIPKVLRYNVEHFGYEKMTPIQKYFIPVALTGRDCMACAETGSGKTAAFLLPTVSALLRKGCSNSPTALVLVPTRELAQQVFLDARKFCSQTFLRTVAIFGGTQTGKHKARYCDLIVATPGRLIDMVKRRVVDLARVFILVLDEADRMLDMGFMPQVKELMGLDMPGKQKRQTMMLGATFHREVRTLAKRYMNDDYVLVTAGNVGGTTENIEQVVERVDDPDKARKLRAFLMNAGCEQSVLVFANTKKTVRGLHANLSREFSVGMIHGDMSQNSRNSSVLDFSSGRILILIATDVLSRGIDIPKINYVVNYDMPKRIEDYVHRIGRTGRIGNTGMAVSYFSVNQDRRISHILAKHLKNHNQKVPEWLEDPPPHWVPRSTDSQGTNERESETYHIN